MAILNVYSNRWGHRDKYQIDKTPTGWSVHHLTYRGSCDKRGQSVLYSSFGQDFVTYPAQFGDYLEHLWNELENGNVDDPQEALDQLADWIEACEKAAPRMGVFEGF